MYTPYAKKIKENKNYVYYILAALAVLIIFPWLFGGSGATYPQYSLPSEATFADQKVPLDDSKTYERIDTVFQIYVHDQRGQIILWLKRLNKYKAIMSPILEKAGIHQDFIYLAIKESSLLPCGASSAGAQGWWQFIPETARRYNLKINDYVDERCDIFSSTVAATGYLKELLSEKYFAGDVFSAMAAYNDGEGDVIKMLRTQGNMDNHLGYFSSITNGETGRYVPAIVALKIILENPEEYGFEVPADYPAWNLQKYNFSPKEDVTILTLADAAGLDFLEFLKYNPQLRITYTIENKLPQESSYNIYLPARNMDKLKEFLEQ